MFYSRKNALVFNFEVLSTLISDRKLGLIFTSGRSKLKIFSTFQNNWEKQVFLNKSVFDKSICLFCGNSKMKYGEYFKI